MEKENPFKKIALPSKEIPTIIKKNVMNDVLSVKRIMDNDTLPPVTENNND